MGSICLNCGCLKRRVVIEDWSSYELTEDGETVSRDDDDTWSFCFDCNSDDPIKFDHSKLTKEERRGLLKAKNKNRLSFLLKLALKKNLLMGEVSLKELIERCRELNLIDKEIEKMIVLKCL